MTTYLVTGGCGFIGSHLCAALRARGDAVRVLDDLSTGSVANLAPGAVLLRGDVADPAAVREAMDGVDGGCFHLAAVASVQRGVEDWLGTHRTNLSGTIAVLDAAAAAAAARARTGPRPPDGGAAAMPALSPVPVVYASSAAVYGEPAALPLDEGSPTVPLSAYGADKLGSELHARVAGQVHGVPTFGLRFFNVFGPRQDPRSPYSGVISIFCDRLSRGAPVAVFGDGGQTRDFVHVRDVVAALLRAMPRASPQAPVLNVCTGRPTAVRDLARIVAELCGASPDLRFGPARPGEIRHSLGAPARMRAALGSDLPAVGLREGLEEVVGWLRAGRPGLVGSTRRAAAGRRRLPAARRASAEQPEQQSAEGDPEQQRRADDHQRGGRPRQRLPQRARGAAGGDVGPADLLGILAPVHELPFPHGVSPDPERGLAPGGTTAPDSMRGR